MVDRKDWQIRPIVDLHQKLHSVQSAHDYRADQEEQPVSAGQRGLSLWAAGAVQRSMVERLECQKPKNHQAVRSDPSDFGRSQRSEFGDLRLPLAARMEIHRSRVVAHFPQILVAAVESSRV